ncbi:hypothetical protein ACROYT_G024550 [Oculina patagonica]
MFIVKLVTPLDGTVEFQTHLGDLFCNFGIHLRGQTGMDSTLVDVQTCLQGVTRFLKRCVSDVQLQIGSERITNGPESTVASKTMKSCVLILLILSSISRLLKLSEFISPDAANAINLQSLLTLVIENLHTTTKKKHPAPSLLDYCREFGKAYGLNLPQDPLESNVEEVTEGEEEEVIEEYDSDSDSSLSLSHLSEDDDEKE